LAFASGRKATRHPRSHADDDKRRADSDSAQGRGRRMIYEVTEGYEGERRERKHSSENGGRPADQLSRNEP
jgi:hypothetical protein